MTVALPQSAHRNRKLSLIATERQIPLLAALPAATLVSLPIGDLEAPRLAIGPGISRDRERLAIVAVEHQNQPLIGLRIRRQRGVIDQKPDIGAIRIAFFRD